MPRPLDEFPLTDSESYGIPYGESLVAEGWYSPYYDDSHRELRKAVRKYGIKYLQPYAHDWEVAKAVSEATIK